MCDCDGRFIVYVCALFSKCVRNVCLWLGVDGWSLSSLKPTVSLFWCLLVTCNYGSVNLKTANLYRVMKLCDCVNI